MINHTHVASSPRLRILYSAYACEPGKGSEAGVGWNFALHMARHHDVWVLTRANNQAAIAAELALRPVVGLKFLYFDLPYALRWWKRGPRGATLYYYLWQIGTMWFARQAHCRLNFDLAQHLTFVRYWMPSGLAALQIPFIWGPVGGAEFAPRDFETQFPLKARLYEAGRRMVQGLVRLDPFLRFTAVRSRQVYATTIESQTRLLQLGVRHCKVCPESALSKSDLVVIGNALSVESTAAHQIRFIAIGRLLALKGYHLALHAFAEAGMTQAEFWFIGDGPKRDWLEKMAVQLGLANVRFWGQQTRTETCRLLAKADVLVHPSLHDSGGWTCIEAMAAGKPIICLDIGGPGFQVDETCGIKITPHYPEQTIHSIAEAMRSLASDPNLRHQLGHGGKNRIRSEFTWKARVEHFSQWYRQLTGVGGSGNDYQP